MQSVKVTIDIAHGRFDSRSPGADLRRHRGREADAL
jgi:hypothetical protein